MLTQNNIFSVILPVFNGEKFIAQSIHSVLGQTFADFELIIIDDASTDNTVEVIQKIKDSRINLIKHRNNKGVCEARNTGLEVAKGAWIASIDADDLWHKRRLEKLLKVAHKFANSFIGSDVMICFSGKNNELIPWKTFLEDRKIKSDHLFFAKPYELVKYGLDTKPIFPIEVVRRLNIKFPSEYGAQEWLYFLLKLFNAGLQYIIINEPLYLYRIRPGSESTKYTRLENQLEATLYIQSVDWISEECRQLIKESVKFIRYRLFTAALLERRWDKIIQHAIQSPLSIYYLLRRIPMWLWRHWEFRRLSKLSNK
jgi:succinoglycan biosynthesis protein ExoO